MGEPDLSDVVDAAVEARDQAHTFNTAVGVAYETYDGEIFTGFNVETFSHKGYHAEEVGLIRAMAEGYSHTDFKRMVEVYQDATHDEIETYPGCPLSCWGWWNEFTHPYFDVVVADTDGDIHYEATLKDILDLPDDGQVYPSNLLRENKERENREPQLPLHDDLHDYYEEDEDFQAFCDIIDVDLPNELEQA